MFGKKYWLDLVVSLSIANLLFMKLWLKILPYNASSNFFLPFSPLNTYIAALLNVVMWGSLLFLLLCFAKGSRLFPWLVIGVILVTCVVVAYGAGVAYISVAKFIFVYGARSETVLVVACWSAALLFVSLLIRYRQSLAKRYAVLPLLFAPYLLVTCSQSLAAIARVEPSSRFLPHAVTPARALHNPLATKGVWIIFDETDYRLAFEMRPSFLALPAFDSLRQTAMSATRAYSPNDNTQTSLPSLLTGIPLARTVGTGAGKMDMILAAGGKHKDFSSQDTIFKQIKKRGGSTALFGWFLPYSRVMPAVDLCRDYPRYNVYTSESLSEVFFRQWREVIDMRFLPFSNTLLGDNQVQIVKQMSADVRDAVRDHDPSLMFLHYSVPHSPNIYDRRTGSFGFNRNKREGYFDNLALADRCLAELRSDMEQKRTWDGALVVVSSDHHWRTNTYDGQIDKQHVPFLVKFPRQRQAATYDGRFNTVLTEGLILGVVDGKIRTPKDAARWLDAVSGKGEAQPVFSAEQPDAD